jgi:opacity protein-like surface antigen
MVRKFLLCAIGAAAAILTSVAADVTVIAPVPVTGKIEWVYSYAEGQQIARKTSKPMFVVFRCER